MTFQNGQVHQHALRQHLEDEKAGSAAFGGPGGSSHFRRLPGTTLFRPESSHAGHFPYHCTLDCHCYVHGRHRTCQYLQHDLVASPHLSTLNACMKTSEDLHAKLSRHGRCPRADEKTQKTSSPSFAEVSSTRLCRPCPGLSSCASAFLACC